MTIKKGFLLLLFPFLSCQSKQEKFIQSELDNIRGQWKIQTLALPSDAPTSLKSFFKDGEILFLKCDYTAKRFASGQQVCASEMMLNGQLFANDYTYDASKNLFNFSLSLFAASSNNTQEQKLYPSASTLFDGSWQITFNTNTMTAIRQSTSTTKSYQGEVSFTAIKK